ncbi:MAG: F0F1 ATP synthase subunit delta [Phycisphaerales bacterium JB039]
MPIDWFTVTAQAINFLILVGLLRYFLYGPIVRAMDRRQQRIASLQEDAEQERREASEQRSALEQQQADLESRRQEILDQARQEGERLRRQILDEAREEADRRQVRWDRELAARSDDIATELVARMRAQLARALEQGFAQLAGADVQDQAIEAFTARLAELDGTEREALGEALRDHPATLRSARDLGEGQRKRIIAAVERLAGGAVQLSFEADEALICGLELRAGGRRLAWSMRSFIRDLDERLRDAVAAHGRGDQADGEGASADEGGRPSEQAAAEERTHAG